MLWRIRTTLPVDAVAVREMHARCSAGSLFRRFNTGMSTVPARLVDALLAPPGGVSLVAEAGDQVVGMAVTAPLPGTGAAEVGLLVEDAWQRQGIGSRLLRSAAHVAAESGFERLVAISQPDNPAVPPTFARAGLPARVLRHDGVTEVSCSLLSLVPPLPAQAG